MNESNLLKNGSGTLCPIDPEISLFLERLREGWSRHPPLSAVSSAEARWIAEIVREPFRQGGPVMAETLELLIPTRHGDMRARLYDPGLGEDAPVLIYLHGGGFTLFSINTHDRLMREYAHAARVKVLGLDYYLAPEHKYPVALDQVEDTLEWIGSANLGVDMQRLALGGDSAGGNLSLAAAIRMRDKGRPAAVKGLLFNYAGFATDCSDEAEALHGGPGSVMDRDEVRSFIRNYTRSPEDMKNPEVNLLDANVDHLPPSFFVIADRDIIAENSLAMAGKLRAAGNAMTCKIYRGATHSFLEAMSMSALARQAIADGADFIARILNTDAKYGLRAAS
ncbi:MULTISPECIES: alpha/beta hydrolase fold domain-containing protein [Chelativorans]|uniref:alpha/beta hydrolase fold domain-containing protein n=1 Tax=Chelativorans TaxID=449972 RepID=UPI00030731B0